MIFLDKKRFSTMKERTLPRQFVPMQKKKLRNNFFPLSTQEETCSGDALREWCALWCCHAFEYMSLISVTCQKVMCLLLFPCIHMSRDLKGLQSVYCYEAHFLYWNFKNRDERISKRNSESFVYKVHQKKGLYQHMWGHTPKLLKLTKNYQTNFSWLHHFN